MPVPVLPNSIKEQILSNTPSLYFVDEAVLVANLTRQVESATSVVSCGTVLLYVVFIIFSQLTTLLLLLLLTYIGACLSITETAGSVELHIASFKS